MVPTAFRQRGFNVICVRCLPATLALGLAACAGPQTNLPTGEAAYRTLSPEDVSSAPAEYVIGPLDEVSVSVFQEPDLSIKEIPVDASGNIIMPLIGQVKAAGKTSRELGQDITTRLGKRYLVDPQVSLVVTKSVSQRVTVEGQVTRPGVYQIEGRTTLLQAVALAQGPTAVADLDEVVVFRTVDDSRLAARFDLRTIRSGAAADPILQGQDIVVVGFDGLKSATQQAIASLPVLGTFFITLLR